MANKCQDGDCVNTEGSYTCECKSGYAKSWKGPCEGESSTETDNLDTLYFQNITMLAMGVYCLH
jgi:hypothetical protein